MCLYETTLKNRKYTKTKKNGGIVPPLVDRRIEYIQAKCGRCIECRKQYARDWLIRLLEDIKTNNNAKFTTLTFSNHSLRQILTTQTIKQTSKDGSIQNIPITNLTGYDKDNAIATRAVRLFMERYRKLHKKSLRHWLVTELGHNGTENIHLHGIIWIKDMNNWIEELKAIEKIWTYGFMWKYDIINGKKINYVNEQTIGYVTKYITKTDPKHKEYKSKVLTSAGIGKHYIESMNAQSNEFKNRQTNETYTTRTGHKIILPTYYRKQLYTETELEQLWINKLDKQEKYILGKKIDISKGDKELKAAIKDARKLNAELGYGSRPNDNRKQHEELRREQMIQKRLRREV